MNRYNLRKKNKIEYFPKKKIRKSKEIKNKEELEEKFYSIFPNYYPPLYHCSQCYVYMGEMNPRQYCEKSHCPYELFEPMEIMDIRIMNLKNSEYVKKDKELKKEVENLYNLVHDMFE